MVSNEYADALYDRAIISATEAGFKPESAVNLQGFPRFKNVFVGGHSNGGIFMQSARIEISAAGFVHMASVKLFNDRLWNDMMQVAGAMPTMFIGG